MNPVPMNDFASEPAALLAGELQACERVLRSGRWILGPEVAEFERAWAAYLGVRYAVGCASGLDAIELGLRALGIGAGDEVITTPMTAVATALAVLRAGATPVFADIDPQNVMLAPSSVQRCLTARTRAILLVHLYGQIGPIAELRALGDRHGIHLIEDCAQAHGARMAGKPAGSFGTFGAWSFYPTKNLGAVGDAGALTTDSIDIADTARCLRNYGQKDRYHHVLEGMNSRLDELQAALLRERLKLLPHWLERRRHIARRYSSEMRSAWIELLPLPDDPQSHAHHLFVVIAKDREPLQKHLSECGIASLIHYPIPAHLQPPLVSFPRDPAGLATSEAHAASCVSLPCHPLMTDEQITRVISAINSYEPLR